MTILIAMANNDRAVLLADRRLSTGGKVVTDSQNKITVLCCEDARVAVAFTGMALAGSFNTADWLLTTIAALASQHKTLYPIMDALAAACGHQFGSFAESRLTVLLCGFIYSTADKPRPAIFRITNWEVDSSTPNVFSIVFGSGATPMVECAGAVSALEKSAESGLRNIMSNTSVPETALVSYALNHVTSAARSAIGRTIGEHCNGVLIRAPVDTKIVATYHTPATSNVAFTASLVTPSGAAFGEATMTSGGLLCGPNRAKKLPCWCGSGKRTSKCHALKPGEVVSYIPMFQKSFPISVEELYKVPLMSGSVFIVTTMY